MPSPPLADGVSAVLRSDATAALAALMVIAGAHRDIFAWAARMIGVEPSAAAPPSAGNGAKRPSRGGGRLAKRDRDDRALQAAMRSDPDGTISAWSAVVGKSKGSIATALHRLQDAGLAESVDRRWRLVEEPAPKDPPPRWTKPLSGAERAHQVHLTA
jgi:hypothetical protein